MSSATPAHVEYVLRLADNDLILSQRLSEWCGHAPVLEEELALANIALDLMGRARLLLNHAAALQGEGRDEDQLAFLRVEAQYRNVTLVELPNADFARTVLRNFLYASFQLELWQALLLSQDRELAAIAQKSAIETRYHVRHSADWVIRLGDGTDESHLRAQNALDYVWPYTAEFFSADSVDDEVAARGIGVAWPTLELAWQAAVERVLQEATLAVPARSGFCSCGKLGLHSEFMGSLLTQMQYLQRTYPGARW